jgi:GTPase
MVSLSRCGYVAIIGRPNVGKSTLLNYILGKKVSITSRKPQTTRYRILGIKTQGATQAVYIDTPGLHQKAKKPLNPAMYHIAISSIQGVDVIIFIIEALKWQADDEWILQQLKTTQCSIILAINKVDKLKDKKMLLGFIKELNAKFAFTSIIPLSVLKNKNLKELEDLLPPLLSKRAHLFPDNQLTDVSDCFFAKEIIREKLMRNLGQELPYALTVQIEQFKEEGRRLRIHAIIWVEKSGQKAIVIGKDGLTLKKIGTAARKEMELFSNKNVFLQLWVKVNARKN